MSFTTSNRPLSHDNGDDVAMMIVGGLNKQVLLEGLLLIIEHCPLQCR